jgi:hypothetical protein
MNAAEAVELARVAGLNLAVDGADLVLESLNPPPAAVLDLVRTHKVEIVAALTAASHDTDDAVTDWCDWYKERAAIRQFDGGYNREEAERLAWGETEGRWHRIHGERVPRDLCAGCRRPIGSAHGLELSDGNRVHFDSENACLIRHGERWRAAATQALTALGIRHSMRSVGKGTDQSHCREAHALGPSSFAGVAGT